MLNRGRVVHDVLAVFHRRANERLGRPASPLELDAAEFDALLAAAIAESLPPGADNSAPGRAARSRSPAGRRVACRNTASSSRSTTACGRISTRPWRRNCSRSRSAVATSRRRRPISRWNCARDGQAVRVSGRIDRIDTGHGGRPDRLQRAGLQDGRTDRADAARASRRARRCNCRSMPWPPRNCCWPTATSSPGRPAIGTSARAASGRDRPCGCIASDDGRIELEPKWEDTPRRAGRHGRRCWSAAFAGASSPCAAPTTVAPATAPSAPSAASIKSVPWRRHASRRRPSERVGFDRPTAAGGHGPRRLRGAVGGGGLRQDVRA